MIRHSFTRIRNIHIIPPILVITRNIFLESNRSNIRFIKTLSTSTLRFQSILPGNKKDDSLTKNSQPQSTNGNQDTKLSDDNSNNINNSSSSSSSSNDNTIKLDSPFIISEQSERVLPEGANKEEFLTEVFGGLDPYIDTYSIYKELRNVGFTSNQSDQIISLLIYQLNSKLTKLSTIYAQNFELENEQYLFESAQQEIRVDITRSRDRHIDELIALINILERDFNAITDELNNDFLKLRNDSAVMINEAKSENTLQSKKMFLKIQETNHKITTDLSSNIKSEIESLRWYLSRWGLITLLTSLFMALIIFYSSKRKNVTEETRKEFAPLIIREPSEYDDEDEDDYHTELDRSSV